MSNTDSPKLEFGKKAILIKTNDGQTSTTVTNAFKDVKVTIVRPNMDVNVITSRTQVNIKVQNRRNAYQKLNKKLGEN